MNPAIDSLKKFIQDVPDAVGMSAEDAIKIIDDGLYLPRPPGPNRTESAEAVLWRALLAKSAACERQVDIDDESTDDYGTIEFHGLTEDEFNLQLKLFEQARLCLDYRAGVGPVSLQKPPFKVNFQGDPVIYEIHLSVSASARLGKFIQATVDPSFSQAGDFAWSPVEKCAGVPHQITNNENVLGWRFAVPSNDRGIVAALSSLVETALNASRFSESSLAIISGAVADAGYLVQPVEGRRCLAELLTKCNAARKSSKTGSREIKPFVEDFRFTEAYFDRVKSEWKVLEGEYLNQSDNIYGIARALRLYRAIKDASFDLGPVDIYYDFVKLASEIRTFAFRYYGVMIEATFSDY